ncbi:helix-turn-helix transcriptional regulator [Weissella diestrammenae]|uniref:Helix-turn-helix transcriptional regulator n=1 Tax=Weissella diestrammenae TaxID=1162633 RepID=A0A7G9T4F8_9LACO|nr:helix-turn-helix transcriptional regulator [Weissella diestrammenae]MCM0583519.1 helix-turn-helix transcriptional regulator [Weissella diestrammenae]QNN74983.1 helix-turn-helix transcriptional regulator [Weissella diestrammenae]
MSVFDNIKTVAKERGLSLQVTAERAGLSKNAIYQYKNGKNPSLETLTKIADVLNVSTNRLINNSDDKTIQPNVETDNSIEGIKKRLVSYGGHPVTDHDAKLIKQYLDTLYEGRE